MGTPTGPVLGNFNGMAPASFQLRRFSGSSKDNPEAFLKQLTLAKGACGWSEGQALCYAGLHLDGKAAEWFCNNDFTTWKAFDAAFLERFGLDPSKMLSTLSKAPRSQSVCGCP